MKICARCFGLIIGLPLGIIMLFFINIPSRWFAIPFIMPGVVDFYFQYKSKRMSNNILRLVTGILLGIGIGIYIYLWITEGY